MRKRKVKRSLFQRKGKKNSSQRPKSRLLWLSIASLFLLVSCGNGNAPVSLPKKGIGPSAAKKKPEPIKTEEKKEAEQEEVYAYNPSGKPDPFKPFLQLTPVREVSRSVPLTPLQRFEISQLKLVAILSAPDGNIGLVEDATGKGYFIKKGTLIGKNDGKVAKILPDRVIVEEVFLDVLGQKKVNEMSLSLHKVEEGGEK
ncbi:MAG TPA: pilus assembly protein PilP [Thermodesulfobacteriota bacterium]|nr:pilus assembly protein PilP [Thermodesulfobacteriota bacterium]